MSRVLAAVLLRDLKLAWRRRADALLPLGFLLITASLFPIGVGPEPQVLREVAAGVVWACALLAAMLSLHTLYAPDQADGTLEQMLLCGRPLWSIVLAKSLAHWLVAGLPLVLLSPLLGLLFGMPAPASGMLGLSLLIGTPVLSLLGGLGAALTLGLRGASLLLLLLVLPLCVPVLVFGTGAVIAVASGLSAQAHLSLLGASLIFSALLAPPATAAALRIATE